MKRHLHARPFFPDICRHVDRASLVLRYLFDLTIFILSFDCPITLEIILKATRGFSINTKPAARPSLSSGSFCSASLYIRRT